MGDGAGPLLFHELIPELETGMLLSIQSPK
jgi:hypothetical protein